MGIVEPETRVFVNLSRGRPSRHGASSRRRRGRASYVTRLS